MKTCEDCLHKSVCDGWKDFDGSGDFNHICDDFTDRSEWVHLPSEEYTFTIRGDIAKECIIANCRAAEEEPKTGKWVLEKDPNGKPYCFHCSKCDKDFSNIGVNVASKFCPNCGSKMDNEHII